MTKELPDNIFIPERFTRIIALHIVKNLMKGVISQPPLILGIHGPSGNGKTFQTEFVLRQMGIRSFLISGGQLESYEAGEPAKLIRSTYISASRAVENNEGQTIVLINDFDTGLGYWGDLVQYTVNRQLVFGELMHIVDYPTIVEGRKTFRIPIIVTGNNFSGLYGPLIRAGRMTSFEWIPELEERTKVIINIFPELSFKECQLLIRELDQMAAATFNATQLSLPIAFFSNLRSTLTDDLLWEEIRNTGLATSMVRIAQGVEPIIKERVDLPNLLEVGKALVRSGYMLNHLEKRAR